MTSVSWVIPTMDQQILEDMNLHPQPNTPNINTCRPMSYQEDGAKVSWGGGGQYLESRWWAVIRMFDSGEAQCSSHVMCKPGGDKAKVGINWNGCWSGKVGFPNLWGDSIMLCATLDERAC